MAQADSEHARGLRDDRPQVTMLPASALAVGDFLLAGQATGDVGVAAEKGRVVVEREIQTELHVFDDIG